MSCPFTPALCCAAGAQGLLQPMAHPARCFRWTWHRARPAKRASSSPPPCSLCSARCVTCPCHQLLPAALRCLLCFLPVSPPGRLLPHLAEPPQHHGCGGGGGDSPDTGGALPGSVVWLWAHPPVRQQVGSHGPGR